MTWKRHDVALLVRAIELYGPKPEKIREYLSSNNFVAKTDEEVKFLMAFFLTQLMLFLSS